MNQQNIKKLLDVLNRIAKALEKSPLTINVEAGGTVKVEPIEKTIKDENGKSKKKIKTSRKKLSKDVEDILSRYLHQMDEIIFELENSCL